MPKPYPVELRERVLRACDGGLTQAEVAEQFEISRTTLVQWLRQQRETGGIEPRPHGGGMPAKVDPEVLEQVLTDLPDGTRVELTALYNRKVRRGGRVHASSLYRALRRLGSVSTYNSRGRRCRRAPT